MDNNRNNPERSIVGKIVEFGSRYIDYKRGTWGVGVMSPIVFGINYYITSDLFNSSIAAGKQAAYTFFFGGAVMKSCAYLATHIRRTSSALAAAAIIPSAATISLTYGLHNLKGTPRPLESTLPTLTVVPCAYGWARYVRRKNSTSQSL